MSDLQDLRGRLRDTGYESSSSGGGLPFWLVAVCAVAVGFAVVLFAPRVYTMQRTAALPTFQQTRERIVADERGEPRVAIAPPPSNPSQYVGKSTDEMGKIADAVCFQRAQALHPSWSKTPRLTTKELSDFVDAKEIKHFDALMHCLVTEAPARYCSASQRTMIKAEIAMYFRGIEYANVATKNTVAQLKAGQRPGPDGVKMNLDANPEFQKLASMTFAPDEKVLAGIEALMQAGYLSAAQRADIGTVAPKPVRERLARVVGSKLPCPDPPWWAVWR